MIESDVVFTTRYDGLPLAASSRLPLLADTLCVEFGRAKIVDHFLAVLTRWDGNGEFQYGANVMTISVAGSEATIEEDGDVMPPGRMIILPLGDLIRVINQWRNFLESQGR